MVVERETNKLLRCIRTYNGGKFRSNAFEEYCSKHGIKHVKIVVRSPQQNGTTERMNWKIMEKVRSMLSNFGLRKSFFSRGCSYYLLLNKLLLRNCIGWWHS